MRLCCLFVHHLVMCMLSMFHHKQMLVMSVNWFHKFRPLEVRLYYIWNLQGGDYSMMQHLLLILVLVSLQKQSLIEKLLKSRHIQVSSKIWIRTAMKSINTSGALKFELIRLNQLTLVHFKNFLHFQFLRNTCLSNQKLWENPYLFTKFCLSITNLHLSETYI